MAYKFTAAGRDLSLEDVLDRALIEVLDDNNVTCASVDEERGQYYVELEFYSLYHGDQIIPLCFEKDNPNETFAEALSDYYEDFDVDEYVALWLDARKERPSVCNLSARQLVEDGESVDRFLCELSYKLNKSLRNVPTEPAVLRLLSAIKRGVVNATRIMQKGSFWNYRCTVMPVFCSYGQIGYTFRFDWCNQTIEWDYEFGNVTLNGVQR